MWLIKSIRKPNSLFGSLVLGTGVLCAVAACKADMSVSGLQDATFANSPLILGIGKQPDSKDPGAFRIYATSTKLQDIEKLFLCFDTPQACLDSPENKTVATESTVLNNQKVFVSKKFIRLSHQLAFYVLAKATSQSQVITMQVQVSSLSGGQNDSSNNNRSNPNTNPDTNPDPLADNQQGNTSECIEAPDQFVCDVEVAIWKLTNEFRVKSGRRELGFHPKVSYVARLWSQEQARRGRIGHEWFSNGKLSSLYRQKFGESVPLSAENVAQNNIRRNDAVATARSMVNQWINSGGHRANMLGNHSHLGVGVAIRGSQFYGTHSFVRER